ncbi:SDR family oxidoreductase [uncultured Variovorax sp.]|uniref:SDR family NAD(P)-dependent oxidoreductase n=1 Tax=uncultured Variovorax sp. TaxID=114708 RepID=UPI0025E4C653|nr:SDR family oxidoreductase [uncultured Variovorax sp.]
MQRFKDRVVIVTGAGSGIGEATARRFSQEGASVVLAGDTLDKLERVARDLPKERTLVKVADVSSFEQVQALVDATIERFGALHVLFNNAGIAVEGTVTQPPLEDWNRIMAVNAGGVFHGCRAAMPHLVRSKGSIVNTASVSGLGGDWAMGFYNASKGAIVNFTKALALDHGKDGVRVNAVCPSLTFTPMTEDMKSDSALMAKFAERIPLGRGADPSEIAAVVAFLASDDASFVTGVAMPVDGGLMASNGQPDMG